MATRGAKLALLLGLFMAASLIAAARPIEVNNNKGTATIYNPAMLAMDIVVDDNNVRVTTGSATLDITHAEQQIQISVGGGEEMDIMVHDGDVMVVIPDPADAGDLQAFKVVEGGEEPRPDVVPRGVPPPPNGAPPPPNGVPRPPRPQVVPANFPNVNVPLPDMRP